MTLILNGTDNSATTPAVTGTDTDTGVYYPSAGALAIATNGTLRLQVNSGGDTCFNNSSFSTSVNCLSINSGRMFINKSDDWAIEMSGANATRIRLYSSAGGQTTTVGSIQVNTTSALYNAGDVQLNSNGVTFPATQSASGNANTLDDYEEGSFTVSCYGGSVAGTPATATGTYIKVGKLVYARWALDGFNRPSGASGDVYIGGLPFTIDASNTSFSHNPIGLFINGTGTGTAYNRGAQSLRDVSSGGTILRVQTENSTTADVTNVQISNLGTTYNYLRCDFVYETSA